MPDFDTLQHRIKARDGSAEHVLSDAERLASRRGFVGDDTRGDIWVFAYGSLIWKPDLAIKAKALGGIYGYHRGFYLKSHIWRGTMENPGLVLGLDRGGSCQGQALCIDKSHATAQLDRLWAREMVSDVYHPKWLTVYLHDGRVIKAIGFVMNRNSSQYAGAMPLAEQIRLITTAHGLSGACLEYLHSTHQALGALSIRDKTVEMMMDLIKNKA